MNFELTFYLMILLATLGSVGVLIIIAEPTAARLAARSLERIMAAAVSLLRSHAAGREAARVAYREGFSASRAGKAA